MHLNDLIRRPLHAPETEGASGGDSASSEPLASFFAARADGDEGDGETPGGTRDEPPGGAETDNKGVDPAGNWDGEDLPDWLIGKYAVRNEDGKVDLTASAERQAQGYRDLYGRFSKKTDDLKAEVMEQVKAEYGKEIGVPDDPSEYEYPEGWQKPDEAVDGALRDWAKKHNVSPDGFRELVDEVWAKTMPDLDAEKARLGEGAENRIGAVNRFLSKAVPEALHGALAKVMTSADAVLVMEAVMGQKASDNFTPDGGEGGAKPITREAIRAEMNDPRYLNGDEAYHAYIRQRWQQFAQAQGAS